MPDIRVVARQQLPQDGLLERLSCHPGLPLVAAVDATAPVVRVWDCGQEQMTLVRTIDADARPCPPGPPWQNEQDVPALAWHPRDPVLLIATPGRLRRWGPEGIAVLDRLPSTINYQDLAFSPDGGTIWAAPAEDGPECEQRSDILDPERGIVGSGPYWDAGLAEHPAGGLVVTLQNEQAETLGIFARIDAGPPATLRIQRKSLVLDFDGYRRPLFSPDGRYLAIRGNSYAHLLYLFAFPSLNQVGEIPLQDPHPYGEHTARGWAWDNIAFDRSGALWIATPDGSLVRHDLDTQAEQEFPVLDGTRITGLGTVATGHLVVAAGPEMLLVAPPAGLQRTADPAVVQAFLRASEDLPEPPEPR